MGKERFDDLPINEAQIRPMTKLTPDVQIKTWEAVLKKASFGEMITGRMVETIAREFEIICYGHYISEQKDLQRPKETENLEIEQEVLSDEPQ